MDKMNNFQDAIPCRFLKRMTDIFLSVFFLFLAAPLFLFIAILLKTEGLFDRSARGPIFRHELRVSQGVPFRFYKFRLIKQSVLNEEKVIRRRDRAKTLEKDQFCTRSGKWLKKFYLDELPQFFNILKGDMSFVGPRPFPMDDYEEDLKKGDYRKKIIRAGLSGVVQIHKGVYTGRTDVEMDYDYINNVRRMTPFQQWIYDMKILLKTIKVLVEGKGL